MPIYDNPRSRWFNIFKRLFLKTPGFWRQISYWVSMQRWEWKFGPMFRVTSSRWLPGPYMEKKKKHLKISFFRNQEVDYLETWYTALGTQLFPNWLKWWPWVDHDHFYDSQICFLMLLHGWKLIQHIVMTISKLLLIQHIHSTQVSDTGPLVLWYRVFANHFASQIHKTTISDTVWCNIPDVESVSWSDRVYLKT